MMFNTLISRGSKKVARVQGPRGAARGGALQRRAEAGIEYGGTQFSQTDILYVCHGKL